ACNIKLPIDAGEKFKRKILSLPSGAMTSLYRDVINGNEKKRTELDHLLKNFITLGEDLNIPTPYFSKAYENACLLLEENKRKQ
ncbi:MAG: hypothetical protein HUJ86_02335, partial [Synergistes sp.]|nr:hypothetical protein [Synergistes sp.]